jgi:two-component sensor histidine kinase
MCTNAHRQFTASRSTARAARQFTIATITGAIPRAGANVVDDCELVVSELAANAINALANTIDVSIELHHDRIELAITDDADGWPVLQPLDPSATSGRGLQLVAALATSWGVSLAEDRRTIVWALLPCNPLDTTDVPCRFREEPPSPPSSR